MVSIMIEFLLCFIGLALLVCVSLLTILGALFRLLFGFHLWNVKSMKKLKDWLFDESIYKQWLL